MSREISFEGKIGIGLGLIGLVGAGVPVALPEFHVFGWILASIGSGGLVVLGAFVVAERQGAGRRKLIALCGMILSLITFATCAYLYFRPARAPIGQPPLPSSSGKHDAPVRPGLKEAEQVPPAQPDHDARPKQVRPRPGGAKGQDARPAEAFWPIVGCAMAPGVPAEVTPFNGLTNQQLRQRVAQQSESLRIFERAHNRHIDAAAAKGGDFATVQAAIQAAINENVDQYRMLFHLENVALLNELLKRLHRAPPTTSADGLSVDGFATVCGGMLRGRQPLSDLSKYLTALSNQLPND